MSCSTDSTRILVSGTHICIEHTDRNLMTYMAQPLRKYFRGFFKGEVLNCLWKPPWISFSRNALFIVLVPQRGREGIYPEEERRSSLLCLLL